MATLPPRRRAPLSVRVRAWLERWRPILPVLVAEFVVLVGFGALLPVLPLYVVGQSIDVPTLGLITASYSLAKLVAEPTFGYLADRTARKPIMILALLLMALFMVLPLVFTSAAALFVLRFLTGITAGMYDPAARGILVDATEEGERGEVFGLYSSFQTGGLIFGPAIGGAGAALGLGLGFPFLLVAVVLLVTAAYLFVAMKPQPVIDRAAGAIPAARPTSSDAASADEGDRPSSVVTGLLNRPLLAALVMNFGFFFSIGVYEVLWSLYLERLGASLAFIGLTFTLFGLPVMVLSPFAGRLVDRVGRLRFAMVGGFGVALCGIGYALTEDPVVAALIVLCEASFVAFLGPALFALLGSGTPARRSSTAQGVFGAAGTIGLIVASLAAGSLWARDPDWPFYLFVIVIAVAYVLGALIVTGGRRQQRRPALGY